MCVATVIRKQPLMQYLFIALIKLALLKRSFAHVH